VGGDKRPLRSQDVPEDDVGDLRDGYCRDHFERGCRPEQRFHCPLVAERLGEFGRIFPIGVGGARGQPFDEDLSWCAEQDDVIEAGVEKDLIAGRPCTNSTPGSSSGALESSALIRSSRHAPARPARAARRADSGRAAV